MTSNSLPYICINCGSRVEELYKKYSESVLKLKSCDTCHKTADKYIEYDPIIVLIDLVLLSKEAYRHVLFNTVFKNHWKLAILLLLMEAYAECVLTSPEHYHSSNSTNTFTHLDKYHLPSSETKFYYIFVKVFFGHTAYVSIVLLLTFCYRILHKVDAKEILNYRTVWKAITLSYFGTFFLLPTIIWGDNTVAEYHIAFVIIYITTSQLIAYTITCKCTKIWSIIVILTSYAIKIHVTLLIDELYFKSFELYFHHFLNISQ